MASIQKMSMSTPSPFQSDSRREFVKKSIAASVVAAQPTLLAGLLRADGGGGGGGTTLPETTVPETTVPETTFPETSPPWDTTFEWDTTAEWSTIEASTTDEGTTLPPTWETTVETTEETTADTSAAAILEVEQIGNFPLTCNAVTDLGVPRGNQLIIPKANAADKIAYINGVPQIPNLKARVVTPDQGTQVTWSLKIRSERAERGVHDNRNYGPRVRDWNQEWDIEAEFGDEFVGGEVEVTAKCIVGGQQSTIVDTFWIRGKNPLDADCKAFVIATSNGLGKYSYAWAMVQHESRQLSKVYNQFNSEQGTPELPNRGIPDGWGVAQIDRSGHEPPSTASTQEVYNWKTNVAAFFGELEAMSTYANTVLNGIKRRYPNDPASKAPPNFTINGQVFTAKDILIIVGYNGLEGCPWQDVKDVNGNNKQLLSPIRFDPAANPKWSQHPNENNYLEEVVEELNGAVYQE